MNRACFQWLEKKTTTTRWHEKQTTTKRMAITEKLGSLRKRRGLFHPFLTTIIHKARKVSKPSLNETIVNSKHFPLFWHSDSISAGTNRNPELPSCFSLLSLLSLPSFISLGRTAVKHKGKHSSSGFGCFQLPVSSQSWIILIKFGSFIKERDKEKMEEGNESLFCLHWLVCLYTVYICGMLSFVDYGI